MRQILTLLFSLTSMLAFGQYRETVITDTPFPMNPIKEYIFPDKEFLITKYGAKSDGKTLCTKAFKRAMAACNKAGGGYVVVPKGKWITGAIHFKSNCNLRLDEGAVVEFTDNQKDYRSYYMGGSGVLQLFSSRFCLRM